MNISGSANIFDGLETIFLPGLATDKNLFSAVISRVGGCSLNWLKPYAHESLKDYSKRLAMKLSSEYKAPPKLFGFCFGGVVAMEVAQHIPLHSLVTLNTPGDSNDISDDFRKSVQIGVKMPLHLLKGLMAMKGTSFFQEKENLNHAQAELVGNMLKTADLEFLRWSAKASATWECPEPLAIHCPHLALHGEIDPLVKKPKKMKVEIQKDQGHLAPLTHPSELSQRLEHFWKNIPNS